MLDALLIGSRFLHYTATLTLFGISIFPFYSYPGLTGSPHARGYRSIHMPMRWLALTALLSAVFWFTSVVANMTGAIDGMLNYDAIWSVLRETSFGTIWIARLILVAIISVLVTARGKLLAEHRKWLLPALLLSGASTTVTTPFGQVSSLIGFP